MISKSNLNVANILSKFKIKKFNPVFLVPTETGLKKSIMDATETIRSFLKENNIHDFDKQRQGEENKVLLNIDLISKDNIHETKITFYRPNTKKGDPRLWIYGLKTHSLENDLLALIQNDKKITVINCSNSNLDFILNEDNPKFKSIHTKKQTLNTATELFNKILSIYRQGYIKTKRVGDTGIGYTLETLLGIQANSSRNPDYKGIEIKSSRKRTTKPTLFSKAPNWTLSNFNNGQDLATARGKNDPNRGNLKTLFHTISHLEKNSYDLKLLMDNNYLYQIHVSNNSYEKDVLWELDVLKETIKRKHKETFWISAKSRGQSGTPSEEFLYDHIVHTGNIDLNSFIILIETGDITVDYLLWEKKEGWQNYINKNGHDFLFKIKKRQRNLLFNAYEEFDLSEF
ncbi:MvaI/BcnI family restriction endonuclease [Alphaproteobacteria bacterium]|nr:MvaI/BcnI family restriction endonuclease [Alphaproteobacteria bacterium]